MRTTTRFSSRVDDYIRYRPGYPGALYDWLIDTLGLSPGAVVADVGSGTGIFAEGLLGRGIRVIGVEPNQAMRAAAEEALRNEPRFVSADGSAEATGLADRCVDAVVAAQAFHWFDREEARREFRRITRPPGRCAIIWNERLVDADAFSREYEQFLVDFGTDYTAVDHRNVTSADLEAFFGAADFLRKAFPNEQHLDLPGLKGRVRSSSYMPAPEHPRHGAMMQALEALFHRHQKSGTVTLFYDSTVYAGRLEDT